MKICYAIRHVPFESLGLFEPLLLERGFTIRMLDVPLESLPNPAVKDADLVIILGGPIGAYEEERYPFLIDELNLLEHRLGHDHPTVGICLGAQLMARALGSRVYPGIQKEIGWSPLQLTSAGVRGPLGQLGERSVLHWHGDTFDLPRDAELLASTDITPHQAFSWRQRGVALQFHIEVVARELEGWYVGHSLEIAQWGRLSVTDLRAAGLESAARLEPHAKRVLGTWLDGMLDEGRRSID